MDHIDLNVITLRHGSHRDRDEGVCLLEAVAWWAHEPHSDHPDCVSPVLGAFGRSWNDDMRDDDERQQLKPYIALLPGTAGDREADSRRAWMALDWSVRVSTPTWLDLAGLADHAERLRARPELTGPDDETLELLRVARREGDAARDAARAAAWDAAWAAARAAAWDAAWAAAWEAAWDAAWDAAGDAAWDAARDAAGAAARDAAGAAAGAAARDAAGAAAGDALAPSVLALQTSAHGLYVRMIQAGPHDASAVADHLAAVRP